MKPPICEVCNDRFAASPDNLISFVSDAATEAFDSRAERPGFVGHRPNTGWFCLAHVDQALTRAASMTLDVAVRDIRDAAKPPAEVTPAVQPEPFDLTPELEGVDLRGGAIRRNSDEGKSAVVWELAPLKNAIALEQFLELVPMLFTQLGLGTPPGLATTTRRSWSPMDGAREPDCPYSDIVRHEALRPDGRPAVSVESDQAHWNDNDISNVASRLFINVDGARVSAWASGTGDHDACTALTLLRPTSAVVIDAVAHAFAEWLLPLPEQGL